MIGSNSELVDKEWISLCGDMSNDLIEVRPCSCNRDYDSIEIWNLETDPDDPNEKPAGVLALHKDQTITKGDVRMLCLILDVPCLA